jgi:hypothetical protein
MKSFIIEFSAFVCGFGFLFGIIAGPIFRNCEPESILSTINIPYRLGCELTVPRFKK